jgi:NAD(P)-dependent dehydrogenase (short-subunit alcohol dehydrogenase family)
LAKDCEVLVAGRHVDSLADVTDHRIPCSVGDPLSVQSAAAGIRQHVDEVDVWVYAIGDIVSEHVDRLDPRTWQRVIDANLSGAFYATHYSAPLLARKAHLFYIGAVSERMRLPGLAAYAAAKSGLEALAEVVRKELRRKVTVLRPTAVDTPLWDKVPFSLPAHHLSAQAVAVRLWQSYQDGERGLIDL